MIVRSITSSGRSCVKNASGLLNNGVGSTYRARISPIPRHNLGTSSTRSRHTRVWDGAHRGLALPYPVDPPLMEGVYEHPQPKTGRGLLPHCLDDDLADSLPDVILARDYDTASKTRLFLAKRKVVIPQHDAFEIMALRMLSRANNPYHKVRVNSFLVWWALIPDFPPSPEADNLTETARAATINRIIRILTNLSPAECPNNALIRFGLLAARKGYSETVAERLLNHIFMWSPPALSRKFLRDFIAVALDQPRSAIGKQTLGRWYELAARTQMYSGRYAEAEAIVKECEGRADVDKPPVLPALADAARKAPFTPLSPNGFTSIRQTLQGLHQRRLGPDSLASVIHHYATETYSFRALHQLHDSLRNRYGSSTCAHWQMHPFRMDYWATAEMIYHLRYCNDPLAAFHVYTMYFHNRNFIPPSLHSKLHSEWHSTHDRFEPRSERMKLFRRITGRGTAPSRDRARLMPRAHTTLPVLWEAVARTRLASLRELHELYQAQITNPLEHLDPSHGEPPIITPVALRQLHTRRPSSKSRINIYALSRPPIYQPSQLDFDTIVSFLRPEPITETAPSVAVIDNVDTRARPMDHTASEWLDLAKSPTSEQVRGRVLDLARAREVAVEIGGTVFHQVRMPRLAMV
ncbi:hypothetical protein FRB97_007843 [Tulasnella sp. 331]|nr:hypothetical protein FRB97_007843 [Tulasnella sp. 331]